MTTLAPDAAATGEQLLTLAGVAEAVLGFIDRPDRQVMAISTAEFASMVGVLADDSPSAPLAVGAWQRLPGVGGCVWSPPECSQRVSQFASASTVYHGADRRLPDAPFWRRRMTVGSSRRANWGPVGVDLLAPA